MNEVKFNGVVIFEAVDVETAIALSLDLHRASNVPHSIEVFKGENIVLSLIRQ